MGRILFPAILLHGSYDFSIMVFNFIFPPQSDNDEDAEDVGDPWIVTLLPLVLSVFYVLCGTFYFYYESKSQTMRLQQLDTARNQLQTRVV